MRLIRSPTSSQATALAPGKMKPIGQMISTCPGPCYINTFNFVSFVSWAVTTVFIYACIDLNSTDEHPSILRHVQTKYIKKKKKKKNTKKNKNRDLLTKKRNKEHELGVEKEWMQGKFDNVVRQEVGGSFLFCQPNIFLPSKWTIKTNNHLSCT